MARIEYELHFPQPISAHRVAKGTFVLKAHADGENKLYVKTWAGLASLNGEYFINDVELTDVMVTPLASGTVIKITI
jgi:hypothetical protein